MAGKLIWWGSDMVGNLRLWASCDCGQVAMVVGTQNMRSGTFVFAQFLKHQNIYPTHFVQIGRLTTQVADKCQKLCFRTTLLCITKQCKAKVVPTASA